jgi:hypothetical protein
MAHAKRTSILGAGFSKPAGMPLATELLPLLVQRSQHEDEDERQWLDWLGRRLEWFAEDGQQGDSFAPNIEEVFHDAHFDIEVYRLRQHLSPVGRGDGPGTPWNVAESIESWLSRLEDAVRDVILDKQAQADLAPISRWAEAVDARDSVLTFNYDTLIESALLGLGKVWNHGTGGDGEEGVAVCKLHGSIDWRVAHRRETLSKADLLFDKPNSNRTENDTGHVEDDYRLWRCQTPEQLRRWISGRDLQLVSEGASPRTVGIAGLGAYKQLHPVPGLGVVWTRGTRALHEADLVVVVGFSMSDFDAMAQMQSAEIARARREAGHP